VDSFVGTTGAPPNNYETSVKGKVRRNKRESVCIIDYEREEGLLDDVDLNVMMIISFKEVIKNKK